MDHSFSPVALPTPPLPSDVQLVICLCVCVNNPKALQREFVRPISRRIENVRKGEGRFQRKTTNPKGKGGKRKAKGKANRKALTQNMV